MKRWTQECYSRLRGSLHWRGLPFTCTQAALSFEVPFLETLEMVEIT
jgi:hypothetical protein